MNRIESTFGIGRLIAKHLTGALNADEQELLDSWLGKDIENKEIFNRITAHKSLAAALAEMEQVNVERALANVKSRIGVAERRKRDIRLWQRIASAAAVLMLLGAGVWFFSTRSANGRFPQFVSGAHDIKPGRNTATITLANGKIINLSDAKTGVVVHSDRLMYTDSSIVGGRHPEFISGAGSGKDISQNRDPGNHQEIILSTPRGGTYQVTLPDGTMVWLNAASSLKFPSTFSGLANRKIELNGEAYFEVARDKKHPFIVNTAKQDVEVLGTHFNINSYQDEPAVSTTLLEGSVKVSAFADAGTKSDVTLVPGQQSVFAGDHRLSVRNVNVADVIDWKNGKFVFEREDVRTIMRKVTRWYDVKVVYQDDVGAIKFSGTVSRYENVSGLLEVLQKTNMLHYKIDGRTILLYKPNQ